MSPPRPLPPNLAQAAAQKLRSIAQDPTAQIALRGLQAALPEASAIVRAALEDPAATIGDVLAPMADRAAGDLVDADHAIAAGIARALGRGLRRGAKRG